MSTFSTQSRCSSQIHVGHRKPTIYVCFFVLTQAKIAYIGSDGYDDAGKHSGQLTPVDAVAFVDFRTEPVRQVRCCRIVSAG